MKRSLICLLLCAAGLFTVSAQTPVPVISSYGHLVAFENGSFRELEGRKPQAVFQGGDKLVYIADAGDLKLYTNGKLTTLERGEPAQVSVSKHLLAWKSGPALRIPAGDGANTLCRSVGRYTVSDSIIAYHDLMQQNLVARWNGRTIPIADVLMTSEDVVWKAGSNTLLLYDQGARRVLLFYRGKVSVLCNGTDPGRSVPGGDVVAFMDEYDDTFRVFDKGAEYDVEAFAPASFQVGEGLVAFVNSAGAFRCFQGGHMWDIMDFAPDEYWVRDSVVIFRDNDMFKVFSNGAVETLERNIPTQWAAVGGMVAWLDTRSVLQLFHAGQRITVSKEAGIGQFNLYPGTVTFRSNSGDTKVWWNGKLYSHY